MTLIDHLETWVAHLNSVLILQGVYRDGSGSRTSMYRLVSRPIVSASGCCPLAGFQKGLPPAVQLSTVGSALCFRTGCLDS